MQFTVIVDAPEPNDALRPTLLSLRHQTYRTFEVILVGQHLDDTLTVRFVDGSGLSAAARRNAGIAAAAGDVVAFLTAGAEADPRWLEQLAAGYDSPRVGGVGGHVFDDTGVRFAHAYSVRDRHGRADATARPPLWDHLHSRGETVVALHGSNCSFRREALAEVGGFDDSLEGGLCARLIDRGRWLKPLSNAFVYLRHAAAAVRTVGGGRGGELEPAAAKPADFLPFATVRPDGPRLTVAVVSRVGGDRWPWALARAGHEVHVVTQGRERHRIDFADGVWVHRVPPAADGDWNTPDLDAAVRPKLAWAAAAYQEVRRLTTTRVVDVVSVPARDLEGVFCQCDPGLNTVVTLSNTLRAEVATNPSLRFRPGVLELLRLESEVLHTARCAIAPMQSVVDRVRLDTGGPPATSRVHVVPPGVPDPVGQVPPRSADGRVCVLAGDGPDGKVAAVELRAEFPNVEFVLLDDAADRRRAFADADIVCPADGAACVEAMAHGKPLVGSTDEFIAHGQNGLLVYPNHGPSLVHALRRLVLDPGLRTALGAGSRRRYLAEFTEERMRDGLIAAFRDACGLSPRRAA